MAYPKTGQYIDMKANCLVEVTEISRRFVKYLDESAAYAMLRDAQCDVLIWECYEHLQPVEPANRDAVISQVLGHVAEDPDLADPSQFTDGYCYLIMHCKKPCGVPLIVLHLLH